MTSTKKRYREGTCRPARNKMKNILPWILFIVTVIPRGECRVPIIEKLDVQCGRDGMTVRVEFDIPYNGIIFSKGHYNTPGCHYVSAGDSKTAFTFLIPSGRCGTQTVQSGLENTIVFQNDPTFQEVWDSARKITCKETKTKITKLVTFKPYVVDMLEVQEVQVSGDSVDCWMELQRGKGPFAPSLTGVVKIGEILTLAIFIRDQDRAYDVLVKECYAYDNQDYDSPQTNRIQLTDQNGCTLKEKLLQSFYRTRETGNTGASVIAFAPINAFKFPEKNDIYLTCNVELCKGECRSSCQPIAERIPQETIQEENVNVLPPVETTTRRPVQRTDFPQPRGPTTTRRPFTQIISFRRTTFPVQTVDTTPHSVLRTVRLPTVPVPEPQPKDAVPHAANAFHTFHGDYGRFRTRVGRGKRAVKPNSGKTLHFSRSLTVVEA